MKGAQIKKKKDKNTPSNAFKLASRRMRQTARGIVKKKRSFLLWMEQRTQCGDFATSSVISQVVPISRFRLHLSPTTTASPEAPRVPQRAVRGRKNPKSGGTLLQLFPSPKKTPMRRGAGDPRVRSKRIVAKRPALSARRRVLEENERPKLESYGDLEGSGEAETTR